MTQGINPTTGQPSPTNSGNTSDPAEYRGGHHQDGDVPLGLITALSAAFAAIATFIATWSGPGLMADSLSYFSTGLNWAGGHGFRTFSGMPLTMFPPVVPMIIAATSKLGVSPEILFRVLNAAAASGIVIVGTRLSAYYVSNKKLRAVTTVLLAVNVAILDLSKMALSECLFLLICLGYLLTAERLRDSQLVRSLPILGALVILGWLGFGTRYAGVVLVVVGVMSVALAYRCEGLLRALVAATAFGVASVIGPGLIMFRNHGVDGTLMGPRTPSTDGLMDTLIRFIAIPGKWCLPDPTPMALQAVAGFTLFGALGILAVLLVSRAVRSSGSGTVWTSIAEPAVRPTPLFLIVYSAYIVAAQTTVAFDKLNSRLMSPILVPLMLVGISIIERFMGHRKPLALPVRRAVLGCLSVILVVQAATFGLDMVRSGRDGVEYGSREWQSMEVLHAAKDLPESALIYSNSPAGTWAVIRRQPVLPSPLKEVRRTGAPMPMSQTFLHDVSCSDVYLVWVDSVKSPYLFNTKQLGDFVHVREDSRFSDGRIYSLNSLANDSKSC